MEPNQRPENKSNLIPCISSVVSMNAIAAAKMNTLPRLNFLFQMIPIHTENNLLTDWHKQVIQI